MKLDITTSQIVWYEGEQAVIRRIDEGGQEITIQSVTGDVITVTPVELLRYNPDLVIEEEEVPEVDWREAYMWAVVARTWIGDDSEEDLYWNLREVLSQLTGQLQVDVEILRDRIGY